MKKILLLVLAIGVGFAASAQTVYQPVSFHAPDQEVQMEPAPSNNVTDYSDEQVSDLGDMKSTAGTFVKIGETGNAYGFYNNPRTYLWADPTINSVVFTHRMTGGTEIQGNSRVAYDLSTDGGATWAVNAQVYTPLGPDPGTGYPLAGGRYPQGGIINPEGNTDPANAFYTYFICDLDNTNANWGGFAYGSNALTATDTPAPSQVNLTTEAGYYRLIPDAFHITPQGDAWYVDGNMESIGADYIYTGELIIGHGEMNDDNEVAYEEILYPFLEAEEGINDMKIAFGPDGMTGYIVMMTESVSDPQPYTNYHPVLLKTTDGGESWSDPIQVQLGGEDGIESLKNYFPDSSLWSAGYEIDVDRDEVYYNMGFVVDLAVNHHGNPYISGIIAIGNEEGWFPNEGLMATFNVYSRDGGETWDADALYDNIWMEGDIGAIIQYNRPYISTSYDGQYLFFSWLDSEIDVATMNDRPNIYVMGYDSDDQVYSEIDNVTYFTQAWNRAFYGSQSYYVFPAGEADGMYTFELPFVFTEFSVPGDDTQLCDFWYIDNYTMDMPVAVPEFDANAVNFTVGQNSPNPATNSTEILVNGQTDLPIELTISNMLGQTVYKDGADSRAQSHSFRVNVSEFDSGIYLYTVKVGNQMVTKKMLVE